MHLTRRLLQMGALLAGATTASADTLVLKAGTVLQGNGRAAIENGVVVAVDGKIVAVGKAADIEVPSGVETIDYGPSAVILPGLVAVDSAYTPSRAGERTADPSLLAIDKFDPYSPIPSALRSGITTVYLAPARGRLIAGQGAVVKSGGGAVGDAEGRIVLESAGLHGSISEEARSTPGYWEPPLPATVDVGLGVERPQLPRTTMGAVLAIEELIALAKGDKSFADEYGAGTGRALAKALADGLVWRMGAESVGEVRALLDVAERFGLPLVIDGATGAASVADEIAAAKVPVIARPHFRNAADVGKAPTSDWPSYDTIARLVGEGVWVAIAAPESLGTSELRFAAALAMRGGLSADRALDAITINAARILGVDDRVGSLEPGKDADILVMTGEPMSTASTVMATVIGGEVVWTPELENSKVDASKKGVKRPKRAARGHSAAPVVISVDELHVGDGTVHSPGEVLLVDGKIAEVGVRVGRPAGARVVTGASAMPGMIDAYGHLGIEGSNRPFSTRFETFRILEPGDFADREVAKRGVTTVNLISRNLGGVTPSIAYKPAAETFDGLVVDDVASVTIGWDSNITALAGENVRQTLARAQKYVDDWEKYEADMAKWTPPAEDDDDAASDEKKDEEAEEKKEEPEADKKKKSKKERDPAKPVTGVFEGTLALEGAEEGSEPATARFRFDESEDGSIEGSLRASLFDELLSLEGERSDYDVTLTVGTPDGEWTIELAQIYSNDPVDKKAKKTSKSKDDEEEAKEEAKEEKKDDKKDEDEDESDEVKTFLRGKVMRGDEVVGSLDVTQTSDQYKVVSRPRPTVKEESKQREPKGKPKEPNLDGDLEPFRRALRGEAAIIVSVNRRDHVLDCVSAFEAFGVKPILFDPDQAHLVADQIAGRVSGVLLPRNKMTVTNGSVTRNRLVELATAGIPVAFLSQAEEGAAELGVIAAMAVARGLSPVAAMRGLTSDAAAMLCIDDQVGRLAPGLDADVLVLDGNPLEVASSVTRTFVNGREVR